MSDVPIILTLGEAVPAELDGHTFQVHVITPLIIHLRRVTIEPVDTRCPVIIGSERCAKVAGHEGKHAWSNGD